MTIKQLTEIVNGSLTPSSQKLDADLLEISAVAGNAIQVSEDGLAVDVSQLATKTELATAIAGVETGGGTPEPAWELTNATFTNGVLTYTGGTYEEEGIPGEQKTGLFAKKLIRVGEKVSVDFRILTSQVTNLTVIIDDGTKVGSYGDYSAGVDQTGTNVQLVAQRDWLGDYTFPGSEMFTGKIHMTRVATDRVRIEVSNEVDEIIKTRDVFIEGIDLKRIWISTKLVSTSTPYSTNIVSTPPAYATELALAMKVDKEAGKGLSTNDYTAEDKEKVQSVRTYIVKEGEHSASYIRQEESNGLITFTVETRNVANQMNKQSSEDINPVKVNSVPLYSLDNNGEYVLTEPDSWVSFDQSNYVFPVYHKSTVDTFYAKGIVTFGAVYGMDGDTPVVQIDYSHNVSEVIDDYVLRFNPTSFLSTNAIVAHTFESSVEGITKFGTIKIPLNLEQGGMTLQQYLDEQTLNKTTVWIEFALKVGSKDTVVERQYGIYRQSES